MALPWVSTCCFLQCPLRLLLEWPAFEKHVTWCVTHLLKAILGLPITLILTNIILLLPRSLTTCPTNLPCKRQSILLVLVTVLTPRAFAGAVLSVFSLVPLHCHMAPFLSLHSALCSNGALSGGAYLAIPKYKITLLSLIGRLWMVPPVLFSIKSLMLIWDYVFVCVLTYYLFSPSEGKF